MTWSGRESRVDTVKAVKNCTLQGHSKIVQRYNANSGAQASEDSSKLAA
jgi:hypothetical protein